MTESLASLSVSASFVDNPLPLLLTSADTHAPASIPIHATTTQARDTAEVCHTPRRMARVLVIGGAGFYGSKVADCLATGSRGDGRLASRDRPNHVVLDLNRPETFASLREFELIVNCSDSVKAAPDAAILATLTHGGTWSRWARTPRRPSGCSP